MAEPPAGVNTDEASHAPKDGAATALRALAVLILPAAFLGGAASAASFLAQTTGRGTPARMTLLVAAITLAEALGSTLAARMPAAGGRVQAVLAAIGAMLLSLAVAHPAAFPVVALPLAFLLGFAQPLRAAAIQRLTADSMRARTASLASACDMVLSTIALPLAGAWSARG